MARLAPPAFADENSKVCGSGDSPNKNKNKKMTPLEIAAALREQVLAAPHGGYLGSEAKLRQDLGVSSPMLRHAARLLEDQQLLLVGRGSVGGYFARHPTAGATARAASLYLALRRTPIGDVFGASAPLMAEIVRLAAGSRDTRKKAAVAEAVQALVSLSSESSDVARMISISRSLSGDFLDMALNPALTLFLRVTYRMSRLHDHRLRIFEKYPARSNAWRNHTIAIGQAVLEGDGNLASLMSRRRDALLQRWIESFERQSPPKTVDVQRLWRPVDVRATEIEKAADQLRRLVLSTPVNGLIGSERDIASRIHASIHVTRQAISLLRHSGLLDSKLGVKGGYYGARPGVEHVVEAAANYLDINHCSLQKLLLASNCLATEACRLAAKSQKTLLRKALQTAALAFDETALDPSDPNAVKMLLKAEQRFMQALLQMAGNASIELFIMSMYRYGGMIRSPIKDHPEGVAAWTNTRRRVAQAVLDGDGEAAGVISARISAQLESWAL